MKRVGLLTILIALILLTGCAKVVDTTEEDITATIVSTHHASSWLQPIRTGKVTTYISHSATWETTVEYNGKEYIIDNEDMYNICNGNDGEEVDCTLTTYYYNDDTKSLDITSINKLKQ